ncbi:hypothetical protein FRB99_006359 [Tulasnella sp. 403]|nr:hypothetical protein FRB99_006359 [Tulasnella sp. 403]
MTRTRKRVENAFVQLEKMRAQDEALRQGVAQSPVAGPSYPYAGPSNQVNRLKRVIPPPYQLDPDGSFSQDPDGRPLKKIAMPGAFPLETGSQPPQFARPFNTSSQGEDDTTGNTFIPVSQLTQEAEIEASRFRFTDTMEDPTLDIDCGGPDQAQELARFFAEQHKQFGHIPSVRDAVANLGLESLEQIIPGLDVRLLPHQVIGVSWMLTKERAPREKGGILADDMGLGKTVQAIALMVMNQPDMSDPGQQEERRKQTLIVAPAALLDQWRDEIETKAEMFRVFIHHGPSKAKTVKEFRKFDVSNLPPFVFDAYRRWCQIVVTSYHTLLYDINPRRNKDKKGPLGENKWYRVFLDEAQIIRNRSGQTSIATAKLNATYRWCLTGTPFTNGLYVVLYLGASFLLILPSNDLYPLLRFGRLRPWNDWESFKEHIGSKVPRDAQVATRKMAAIVSKHLLRRKKTDQLDGRPILQLKEKYIEEELVNFTAEERIIYDAVEKREAQRISKFWKAGTLLKNYKFVLLMILRLRQVCCHPQLIAYAADEIAAPDADGVIGLPIIVDGDEEEEEDSAGDINVATKVMGFEMVQKLKAAAKERVRLKLAKEILSSDDQEDEEENIEDECPICFDFLTNARVTVCGHQFCKDCIEGVFQAQIEYQNDDGGAPTRPCPACRRQISLGQIFKSILFEPPESEMRSMKIQLESQKRKSEKKSGLFMDLSLDDSDEDLPDAGAGDWWRSKEKPMKKDGGKKADKKGKAKVLEDEDEEESEEVIDLTEGDAVLVRKSGKQSKRHSSSEPETLDEGSEDEGESDEEDENPFEAKMLKTFSEIELSAKMLKMLDLLKQWHDESPDDKTIIYSQWTSCMDLLQAALEREDIRHLRYDGKMTREDRTSVIKRFKKQGGPSVLLVSLKCGGVGLNLVEANRVINFDPAWNFASESQAYDRVHRIGQQKEVYVKRLIVRDSIEERILKIQQGKKDLTDAALGEGTGGRIERLNVREILRLFNIDK